MMSNDPTLENARLTEKSIGFLLTEFQGSISQWQHMNDRMDKEIQYYFTLLGVVGTGVGVLLQFGTNTLITLGIVHLLALIVGIAGLRLLRRIIHLTGQGALFAAQIGLIRRAIIDLNQSIEEYLILTTASKDETAHNFTPISGQISVRILVLANSFLAAIAFFLIPSYFYFYLQKILPAEAWIVIFVVAGIASIMIGAIFFRYQKRLSVTRGDKYLDNITKTVQHIQQAKAAKKRVAA